MIEAGTDVALIQGLMATQLGNGPRRVSTEVALA
jgi:hypothetical protein